MALTQSCYYKCCFSDYSVRQNIPTKSHLQFIRTVYISSDILGVSVNIDYFLLFPAKKKGTGLQKPLKMSADLTTLPKLLKDEEMSRPQILKHLWAYLKEHNLLDPENKQWFTPDKAMEPIFG